MPRPYSHIRDELLKHIENGDILLGELIEPKMFTRVKVVDGALKTEKYQVHGRKIPLDEIRLKIYKEHLALGIDMIYNVLRLLNDFMCNKVNFVNYNVLLVSCFSLFLS